MYRLAGGAHHKLDVNISSSIIIFCVTGVLNEASDVLQDFQLHSCHEAISVYPGVYLKSDTRTFMNSKELEKKLRIQLGENEEKPLIFSLTEIY